MNGAVVQPPDLRARGNDIATISGLIAERPDHNARAVFMHRHITDLPFTICIAKRGIIGKERKTSIFIKPVLRFPQCSYAMRLQIGFRNNV